MARLFCLFLIAFCAGLAGCSLEKEIDLNLPEFQSQITVECYLEDGQPYRATVSESTSYFDRPEPVLVPDATVIITHNGKADTLLFQPFFDKETHKFFTHASKTTANGNPGESYALEVFDTRGRRVTGTTTFLPKVPIDSLVYKYNDQDKALLKTTFLDNAATEDFYRVQIYKDSLSGNKRQYDFFTSDRLRNGLKFEHTSTYRFSHSDTIFVNLLHIEKPYYNFLNTLNDAQDANGNPFAQPSAITSTVQGGIGVFTTLVYDRRMLVLK